MEIDGVVLTLRFPVYVWIWLSILLTVSAIASLVQAYYKFKILKLTKAKTGEKGEE